MNRRAAVLCLVTGVLLASGNAPALRAQAAWDAQLAISAYPSPYLSDWEANPSIGTLTITNPGASDQNVVLAYRVTSQAGRLLASGRSDPVLIPRGAPTVITDIVNMSGSSQHDQALEDQMRRTGRLPEGDNTTCVAVTDTGGFVLAEDCATFSIVYPDPPYLVGPLDQSALTGHPIFQWTPLQVPPAFHLNYVVRLSEVLAGQTPEQALLANIPVFETAGSSTTLEYPVTAMPLVEGKTYAWRVQALDQNGYAASSNEGRSEVWTFLPGGAGGGGPEVAGGTMRLEVYNARSNTTTPSVVDTLGFTDICKNWDVAIGAGRVLSLGLNSPIGFPGFASLQAQLLRHTDALSGSKTWALVGNWNNKYRLMLYGDCDGWTSQTPWPQWLAIRTISGATSAQWLATADTAGSGAITTDTSIADTSSAPGLEFGVVLFTLRNMTVSPPAGFREVREYLADNSIDVKPGINAFGIFQLPEGALWQFFQWLGYDQNEITLQGYVGMNNSWSLGFGASSEGGGQVDLSLQQEFINLTASLPEREPPGPLRHLFSRSHIEFEIKLQDTIQSTRQQRPPADAPPSGLGNQAVQFDLILSIKHVLELSPAAIEALSGSRVRLQGGTSFVNTTALDIGRTGSWARGWTTETELKLVKKYELDGYWEVGVLRFGHPQLEVDITLNGTNRGTWMLAVTGTVGLGNEPELGVLGFTIGQKATTDANRVRWEAERAYHERLVSRLEMNLSGRQAQLARGAATETDVQNARDALATAQRLQAQAREMADNSMNPPTSGTTTGSAAGGTPAATSSGTWSPIQGTTREWTWALRFSLGNMSITRLLALMTGRDP